MPSSSDSSSSEDENWAALQSVAVSYETVVAQSQDIADKVSPHEVLDCPLGLPIEGIPLAACSRHAWAAWHHAGQKASVSAFLGRRR